MLEAGTIVEYEGKKYAVKGCYSIGSDRNLCILVGEDNKIINAFESNVKVIDSYVGGFKAIQDKPTMEKVVNSMYRQSSTSAVSSLEKRAVHILTSNTGFIRAITRK